MSSTTATARLLCAFTPYGTSRAIASNSKLTLLRGIHDAAHATRRCPTLVVHRAPAPPRARIQRRTFSVSRTTLAALAQRPPAHHTVLLAYPSPSALHEEAEEEEADEPEVDFVPPEEAKIEITDRAAEQLRAVAQRQGNPDVALRISVESGGCHGYQYKMDLAKSRELDDYVFTHPTIRPSNIVVDAVSMALLKGSMVDFATELIGSSFRIMDNPQAKGGSCGCGVSWELKV
ncbi:uncharacterized protein LAESUDRAFT_658657 [Laetiporus sulphureus 93-53]|uniref:Core domain-containing protein n=1 Tax=Laetiporus sulphureus 93-53 TaxID=1314785 RepID=A0A165D1S1_9APHY|nr:uncharacterized protein LAESUDRAFT_658657 [Laetiporus sulphureus 93-53]KZT03978.1 hypothetical protein LAESUDRAFT_658657 [Laetiporus sulphureus 93-53]